jgi:hypothetical protein
VRQLRANTYERMCVYARVCVSASTHGIASRLNRVFDASRASCCKKFRLNTPLNSSNGLVSRNNVCGPITAEREREREWEDTKEEKKYTIGATLLSHELHLYISLVFGCLCLLSATFLSFNPPRRTPFFVVY